MRGPTPGKPSSCASAWARALVVEIASSQSYRARLGLEHRGEHASLSGQLAHAMTEARAQLHVRSIGARSGAREELGVDRLHVALDRGRQ